MNLQPQVSSIETTSSKKHTVNSNEQVEHGVARTNEKIGFTTSLLRGGKSLISIIAYSLIFAASYTIGTMLARWSINDIRGDAPLHNDNGNSKKHESRELSARGDLFNGQSILH